MVSTYFECHPTISRSTICCCSKGWPVAGHPGPVAGIVIWDNFKTTSKQDTYLEAGTTNMGQNYDYFQGKNRKKWTLGRKLGCVKE
jgi:hypothetical protein